MHFGISNRTSIPDLKKDQKDKRKPNFNSVTHKNMIAETVIDANLWDKAKWKAFGFYKCHIQYLLVFC